MFLACVKPRTPVVTGDQKALLETSWCPLGALLEPSWGTVGAYQFDMLEKPEKQFHCRKKGAGGRMPEPGGNLE